MPETILIATRSFGSTSNKPWEVLTEAGLEVRRADMAVAATEEGLSDLLQGVAGAVIGVVPLTERVLASAPGLKVVSMHGVGVDHVDLAAARRLGIIIANTPGANDQAVADLALGLMIAAARKIPQADGDLRQEKWGRYSGGELWSKTLGLVGFGRIGRGVAKRALGFDMRVLVYDPYIQPEAVNLPGVTLTSFEEVLANADFISLHAALTAGNTHMIGAAQFEAMKPGAYLINTARGGLVDEDALYQALSAGRIAGAALDVFVDEPPKGSPLLKLPNVVVTPHIGAHTKEAIERMGVMAAQNVVQALRTGEPLFRVK
ncbi:MAG: phosphoglycerate dehydrogenase [Anaerolineales bacterium]|nr:phosphoglycerate dehydrogenase [Anaerolineales bacterium]